MLNLHLSIFKRVRRKFGKVEIAVLTDAPAVPVRPMDLELAPAVAVFGLLPNA
jgi:hypothetical protein